MSVNAITPQSPFRAPIETVLTEDGKKMSWGWIQWLQIFVQQLKTPANQPVPLNSAQAGQHGQTAVGGGFFYVYDGTVQKWIKFAPVPF